MVEYSIHILREHALVIIIHGNGRISPPQNCLRYRHTIDGTSLDSQISTTGTQGKTSHALLMKHPFHFIHPHRDGTVFIFLYRTIHGHIGTRTVMLRPVELNTAADPWTREPHQCRFYHMIIIHKVTLIDFIVSHLYSSTQFRQNHHFDVFVLQPDSMPFLIHLLIAYLLNDRIRIHSAAAALIYSILQKNRILLRCTNLIRWDDDRFFPSFNHNYLSVN